MILLGIRIWVRPCMCLVRASITCSTISIDSALTAIGQIVVTAYLLFACIARWYHTAHWRNRCCIWLQCTYTDHEDMPWGAVHSMHAIITNWMLALWGKSQYGQWWRWLVPYMGRVSMLPHTYTYHNRPQSEVTLVMLHGIQLLHTQHYRLGNVTQQIVLCAYNSCPMG